jgi:hypothetical protein
MSPFSKQTLAPKERWLKNAKAAENFGVSARTIKRWMKIPARRKTLGAVRHGKQWRIPLDCEMDTDSSPEMEFEKLGREFARYKLETYRLWLAAYLQMSAKSVGVTQEDITAILNLWQTACKILDPLPKGTEVDKLKSQFPESLRARNFSEERIKSIMSYWPEQRIFNGVRDTLTLRQLEKIRHGADTAQAVKTCKNLGQKPTAENLRPLLHKNFMEHINDTREELPPNTIKAHKPEDIRRAVEADCWRMSEQNRIEISKSLFTAGNPDEARQAHALPSLPVIDLRQPQDGLALRTFRNRHPRKKSPQKEIIAAVFDIQNSISGVDVKPDTGKTPVRGG